LVLQARQPDWSVGVVKPVGQPMASCLILF